jgi:methionine synthase I (cobalamin-dependent)
MYERVKQQAEALETGGADAICVETMSAIDEASLAVRAALVPDLVDAGVNIIGGCCGTTLNHSRAIKKAVLSL